jgi:hypothetical protein
MSLFKHFKIIIYAFPKKYQLHYLKQLNEGVILIKEAPFDFRFLDIFE